MSPCRQRCVRREHLATGDRLRHAGQLVQYVLSCEVEFRTAGTSSPSQATVAASSHREASCSRKHDSTPQHTSVPVHTCTVSTVRRLACGGDTGRTSPRRCCNRVCTPDSIALQHCVPAYVVLLPPNCFRCAGPFPTRAPPVQEPHEQHRSVNPLLRVAYPRCPPPPSRSPCALRRYLQPWRHYHAAT